MEPVSPTADLTQSTDREVMRVALRMLVARLPPDWTCEISEDARIGDRRIDARIEIRPPAGGSVLVIAEAKRAATTREVGAMLERLLEHRRHGVDAVLLVVGRYLSPQARSLIVSRGGAYADATGNVRLAWSHPGLFVETSGGDRDPWRKRGRPPERLTGVPAARVVRALADFRPPYSVPQIAALAGVSIGTAYRVVELLEAEDLIERPRRGPIEAVSWRRLIERWSQDYGFARSNSVTAYLEPRGIHVLLRGLRALDRRYALSGSLAAFYLAPHAEVRTATAYVDDPAEVADQLEIVPADGAANVLLASAADDFVFERSRTFDGLTRVAPSQAAVDLLTGPGRNPSEAVALMDWMETHEAEWRDVG